MCVELLDGHVVGLSVETDDNVSDLDSGLAGVWSPDEGDLQRQLVGWDFQSAPFIGIQAAAPETAIGADDVKRFAPARIGGLSPAAWQVDPGPDGLSVALQFQGQTTTGGDCLENPREVSECQHAMVSGTVNPVTGADSRPGGRGSRPDPVDDRLLHWVDRDAQVCRCRVGEDHLSPELVLVAEVLERGDLDVVAVNALVLSLGHHRPHGRDLFGCTNGAAGRLERTLQHVAQLVQHQGLAHGGQERIPVEVRFGIRVISAAVPGVDTVLGVHEERHPGQVEFELEQVQVDAIHRLDADTDKLAGQPSHLGVTTDNLPVKIVAGLSAFAPEDDEHWLASPLGQLATLLVVVDPVDQAIDFLHGWFLCHRWSRCRGQKCGGQQCNS